MIPFLLVLGSNVFFKRGEILGRLGANSCVDKYIPTQPNISSIKFVGLWEYSSCPRIERNIMGWPKKVTLILHEGFHLSNSCFGRLGRVKSADRRKVLLTLNAASLRLCTRHSNNNPLVFSSFNVLSTTTNMGHWLRWLRHQVNSLKCKTIYRCSRTTFALCP